MPVDLIGQGGGPVRPRKLTGRQKVLMADTLSECADKMMEIVGLADGQKIVLQWSLYQSYTSSRSSRPADALLDHGGSTSVPMPKRIKRKGVK